MAEVVKEILQCPVECMCIELENYNYCGSDTVEGEICFVPGVDPVTITKVEVTVDSDNFSVELVCCNLIVVCGFITKKVFGASAVRPIKTKDIPVQIKVPAEICNPDYLVERAWKVTGAEVCTGCYTFACVDKNEAEETIYHKLIEKDIVSVQVDSLVPIPDPPTP